MILFLKITSNIHWFCYYIGLFLGTYNFLDTKLQRYLIKHETAFVDRVIDGDTIVSNNIHIRLLGINAPETTKKEKYSKEAKKFLSKMILNKIIRLEFGKDVHYKEFESAWENCHINLCEVSKDKCANCTNLKEFNPNKQEIIFYNNCSFDCNLTNWGIKDEGRKHFKFSDFILQKNLDVTILIGDGENNETSLFWKGQKYVWTRTGDTLFLRDEEVGLVLWRSY